MKILPLLKLGRKNPGIVDALARFGAFQVDLPADLARQNVAVFELARDFLSQPEELKCRFLVDPFAKPGPNGYQSRGALGGKYNRHRSGFVFHGKTLWELSGGDFLPVMTRWREDIWRLAEVVFDELVLELSGQPDVHFSLSPGVFSEGGAHDMVTHSQFHIKQMHAVDRQRSKTIVDPIIWLPLHQDPSFLSIVVHASANPAGQGLEFLDESSATYTRIAQSGCGVATIIGGQLLHLLCGGQNGLQLAKATHRVVTNAKDMDRERLGATFFFQPAPDFLLKPFVQLTRGDQDDCITFAERQRRAYARYFRAGPTMTQHVD